MDNYLPTRKQSKEPWDRPWDYEKYPKYSTPTKPLVMQSLFPDMFFLGFGDQLSRWGSLATLNKPASFPPYNLIKVDDDTYKVELAVAGYTKDDIDITLERDQLTVSSKETSEGDDDVIYQGIAQRQWRQKFILGEYMEVVGATLKDGLLTINIERNLPEEVKPKTIKIK